MDNITFGQKFERAVHMLAERRPIADENSRKPALFHDIHVGVYLYDRNYSQDVVLAGLLHDAIEWYGISKETLRNGFGESITKIVVACTKDDTLKEPKEKIEKIIKQCIDAGQDALIVKAADIIDSYRWYSSTQNEGELQYCMNNADAIFRLKPDTIDDTIFEELRKWHSLK